MTEIEKVIRGIERCREAYCDECQEEKASHYPLDCEAYDGFVDQAVALLKKRLPIKVEINHSDGGNTQWYVCGNCGIPINPGDNYCHRCGCEVNWDD